MNKVLSEISQQIKKEKISNKKTLRPDFKGQLQSYINIYISIHF